MRKPFTGTVVPGVFTEIADYSTPAVVVAPRPAAVSTVGRNAGKAVKAAYRGPKATEAQVALIVKLDREAIQRGVEIVKSMNVDEAAREDGLAALRTSWTEAPAKAAAMSKSEASARIEKLLEWAKAAKKVVKPVEVKAAAAQAETVSDGFYFMGGSVYKVQTSPSTGRSYAKVLVVAVKGERGSFDYAAGAIRKLTPAMALTKEQAKEFGHLYSVCCRCGATLTAEDSIDRNMGPVCYGKMGF
jgi:hypothetical protein